MSLTDIFTEPADVDLVTLRNLEPLRPLAGIWEGNGVDEHPVSEGGLDQPYTERFELQPIDPQTNGPQLLYGLRYHVHVMTPGEIAALQAAEVERRQRYPEPFEQTRRGAFLDGFSLHAGASDRDGRERLCTASPAMPMAGSSTG